MDAFEKLAKLAGASVESIGEGLPKTRAEAKALGVKRYFTGEPCKHGHVAVRLVLDGMCRECHREKTRKRGAMPEYKERRRQRRASPEYRERTRRRDAVPQRQRKLAKAGDAVLFAINQAERAAVCGRAPADIVPQCPEPQRSQLQALVDRIKADPQAGKAVVGLLRTMRDLRKAELAEMRASGDSTP